MYKNERINDRQTDYDGESDRKRERKRGGERKNERGRKRENDLSRWFESQAASCIRRKFVLIALRHFIHLFRLDQII
jgi:hypothetical protein